MSDSQMTAERQRPITIALYLAITRADESAGLRGSHTPRRLVAQIWDIVGAFVRNRPQFRFHRWAVQASNKGDIAIREEIRAQLARELAPRPLCFIEIGWGQLDAATIEAINAKADFFVIAGSGYFFPSNGNLPPRLFDDANALQHIRCPKIAYSVGWNTLAGEEAPLNEPSLVALKKIVNSLDMISVRDRPAQASVEAATGIQARLTADPVFFHMDNHAALNTASRIEHRRRRLGVNIALHGPVSAENVKRDINKIADLLKLARDRLNLDLHFISHSASDRLIWWLLLARGVRTHWHSVGPDRMSALYATLDVHFGQMMHSTIFSIGAGIPTVTTAYDRKTVGFFDLLSLSEFVVDITNWEQSEVLRLIERAINERDRIRNTIESRRVDLATQERIFLHEACSLIKALAPKPVA